MGMCPVRRALSSWILGGGGAHHIQAGHSWVPPLRIYCIGQGVGLDALLHTLYLEGAGFCFLGERVIFI